MDEEDVLRERINSLIDNGLLSVEMLQEATGIVYKHPVPVPGKKV